MRLKKGLSTEDMARYYVLKMELLDMGYLAAIFRREEYLWYKAEIKKYEKSE